MIRAADTNNDKSIDKKEFIAVMKHQGKGRLSGQEVMQKMRTELKRFLKHKKLLKGFKNMKPHIKWIFDQVHEMNEEYKMDHKKKKPMENFDQSMFDDVWEIL
jgi:tRNA-dihydrouridine synthase